VNSGVTTFTYDAQHQMRTIRDPRNIVYLTNDYDANGRVQTQTQADSTTYQFAYTLDANGKVIQTDVTNPRGFVRRLTFNGSGYALTDTRAFGTPLAQTMTYVRQAGTNLLLSVTDALNRKTTYTHDSLGNMLTITRLADTPDAVTATFTYEPTFSQIATITDPLTHVTTFAYDARGNLVSRTDANGNKRTIAYDILGRPTTLTDGAGNQTTFSYLGADLFQAINPVGNTVTRGSDGVGRLTQLTNGKGDVTGYEYNPFDQIIRVIDAATEDTTLGYDPNGNVLSLTDARDKVTSYTYNSMGRNDTRTDPLLRGEQYVYDANGNLRQVTDRKGQVTTYTYDALDRLSQITYNDQSTTTYTYDAGDRLLQVADSIGGTITRTYDGLDRLTSETTPEGAVSYTYDGADRRATMTVAGQPTITYGHDSGNRLTSITQASAVVTFGYDAADRRTTLTLPNGIVVTSIYDAASRVSELTYTLGTTKLGTLSYAYDADGNRTAVGGTWARTGLPPALASAAYDDANQILTWAGTSFAYDGNGNLTYDGQRTYSWNARDQLTGVGGGVSASFSYDGSNRRQSKTVGGSTTGFLYDGLNVVQELVGATPSATMLSGLNLDEWFTRSDGTGTRHFLSDVLGSTLALADSTGALESQYSYQPFGTTTISGPASNPSQFTGRESDETGLQYYRARYYDPGRQRFVSEDPLGSSVGDINVYAYVRNNPTNLIDPLGLSANCTSVAVNKFVVCMFGLNVVWISVVELGMVAACVAGTGVVGTVPCFYALHHAAAWGWAAYNTGTSYACFKIAQNAYKNCQQCPQ
jgi:RHS repeat-associated protein